MNQPDDPTDPQQNENTDLNAQQDLTDLTDAIDPSQDPSQAAPFSTNSVETFTSAFGGGDPNLYGYAV